MRTIIAVLGLALAVGTAGCSKDSKDSKSDNAASSEPAAEKFATMTVDEVDKAVAANEVTPVDCNGDRTRKKMGVVPGAVLVTDEESYAASELPADKTRKLVFYCADPG